jgi:hypothetical protein
VAANASAAGAVLVPTYIKSSPTCPSSGTYAFTTVGAPPTCTVSGTAGEYNAHVLP